MSARICLLVFLHLTSSILADKIDSRIRHPAPKESDVVEWPSSDPQCTTPNGYFAHPLFCDQYYVCSNGKSTILRCPNGLIFNPKKKFDEDVCDYPWNSDCSSTIKPTPPVVVTYPSGGGGGGYTEKPTVGNHCPREWGLYPHETDCGKFYNCANGYAYLMDCPAGLHFNPYSRVCDWPDSAGCTYTSSSYKCPLPTGFFPVKNDCYKFYVCIHGSARLLGCPKDAGFDSSIGYCVKGYRCSYA